MVVLLPPRKIVLQALDTKRFLGQKIPNRKLRRSHRIGLRYDQQAQQLIADDYVNGFLFQLANTSVARAELTGLWADAPTQAVDLTGVSWAQ